MNDDSGESTSSFRAAFAKACRDHDASLKNEEKRPHALTALAQHAYAVSLGATLLNPTEPILPKEDDEDREASSLAASSARAYLAVPEERVATRFDIVLQAVDGGKKQPKNFCTFATFRDETYACTSSGSGKKIFDAKKAFEKSRVVNSYLPKSDGELHELFSESMFDPIYRAYGEAVATVPNKREPPSLRATPKELLERIFAKVRGVDLCAS